MAHDIEHAFKNGCPHCREAFASMPNGLADVTLDILDPKKPYYSMTRWICMTCNRRKGKMSPEDWAEEQRWERKWREQRARRKRDPWYGTLFASNT